MSDFTDGMVVGQNGNGGVWGESWLWIIVIFALLGFGGGGFGRGGVQQDYVLATDFATIERKIDGVNNGICSLGYDQLAQMNGINMNVMQGFSTTQAQLADCCCKTQRAIDSVNYANATNTRDIIESQNAGTRAILDKLCAYELEAKNTKIAEQQQCISALQLAASQQAQNAYLIGQLRPSPIPAYTVANPYCCNGGVGYGYNV